MSGRLLLVDDLAFMRTVLREHLEAVGMEIAGEAENGKRAVDLYKEIRPDGVVLDITMPVMDGIQALHRIRDYDPHAVVVICSALGQEQKIIEAIQAGAKDFVVKPFTRERIVSAVQKAIATAPGG